MPRKQRLKFDLDLTVVSSKPYLLSQGHASVLWGLLKVFWSQVELPPVAILTIPRLSWLSAFARSNGPRERLSRRGMLDSHPLRICVRRELRGGLKNDKMGVAVLDLGEFAGRLEAHRRYLLQPETANTRQGNSILEVTVSMRLVDGPPVFKARPNLDELEAHDSLLDNGLSLTQALGKPGRREAEGFMSLLVVWLPCVGKLCMYVGGHGALTLGIECNMAAADELEASPHATMTSRGAISNSSNDSAARTSQLIDEIMTQSLQQTEGSDTIRRRPSIYVDEEDAEGSVGHASLREGQGKPGKQRRHPDKRS
ncbi:uncharacterized protein MONBRDRAFT_22633 [Monosiga brevicollis MX1]|uniref:C2 NT-type domain-containing protein n=1 Tax=Monosiga brevicollis TaxID=81824 RepID=A9UNL2_MONBE|nr:uncharacterized protein MONBRDRAFT_22633 [Monosiga brevicollis MX1]EDQ92717.1 predicted protein [Monosiga brevicollis MX1]|eukprot:XP_001742479.1 hypothetical protein [Monosiga brevicollis MX1]